MRDEKQTLGVLLNSCVSVSWEEFFFIILLYFYAKTKHLSGILLQT